MEIKNVLIPLGFIVIGYILVAEAFYVSVKTEHADLMREIKNVDRRIEKTEAIKCYGAFAGFISGVLDPFPFSSVMKKFFFPTETKCDNDKQSQLRSLNEKKQFKNNRTKEMHELMKELHPMRRNNSTEVKSNVSPELGVKSGKNETEKNKED